VKERIERLVDAGVLSASDGDTLRNGQALLTTKTADRMIENVIGTFGLPFAIAPNFVVNSNPYVVPMVVEEPSIVAAVSSAAKLFAANGGFSVTADEPVLIGQIQLSPVADPDSLVSKLQIAKEDLVAFANTVRPNLLRRGGGVLGLDVRVLDVPADKKMVVVHLRVDTRDAMGANIVNTICEHVAPRIEALTGSRVSLRILSNLADTALVTARCVLEASGEMSPELYSRITEANDFAMADPHRAATHNKGIMNGIDAVAIATGNDWRAIEAGAHAYAARDGQYRALTTWSRNEQGDLSGELRLPLKVGIVGGSLESNPGARLGLRIVAAESATELAGLMAAVGLAQNFAALRALVTDGIQRGHMRLHARSVAVAAGVSDDVFDTVVTKLRKSGDIGVANAKAFADAAVAERNKVDDSRAGASIGVAAGKVILLGEHAVVYGKSALAVPIPDAVTVSVRDRDDKKVSLHAPTWGMRESWSVDEKSFNGPAAIVDLVMQEMREKGVGSDGLDIQVHARIPVAMGLGASAAFAVAVIRALATANDLNMSDSAVNDLAYRCEELTHGTPSGVDNHVATFAEPLLFRKDDAMPGERIRLVEMPPIVLASSGDRGLTRDMVAGVRQRYENNASMYAALFEQIDELSRAGAGALVNRDYTELGAMMDVCQGLLNALQVSTPLLESMVDIARRAGASGAKLTGAGGGGCIVALCPGAEREVSLALREAGFDVIQQENQSGAHE